MWLIERARPGGSQNPHPLAKNARRAGQPLGFRDGDRFADMAFGFLQCGRGLRAVHGGCQHYYCDWGAIAAGFQSVGGRGVIGSGGLFHDSNGALDELFVFGPDVDHEVAVDIAEASHGGGGDHVQNHLVGGAGFHAGRSGENFGADFGDDGEIGGAFERGVSVAGEGDGAGSAAAGVFDGGDGEGGASAAGDAEDDIMFAGLAFLDFGEGECGVVFAGFGGGGESFGATGHDVLHGARIGIESGRNLGGVECAEAAAGSGADIDEAAALAESGDDDVNGTGDLREGAADRGGDGRVFLVDEADDFKRRHEVEFSGGGKDLFGGQNAEVRWLAFQVSPFAEKVI